MLSLDRKVELTRQIIVLGHAIDAVQKRRRSISKPSNLWTLAQLNAEYRRLNAEHEAVSLQQIALTSLRNPYADLPVANGL
jgi:hypothetical protein